MTTPDPAALQAAIAQAAAGALQAADRIAAYVRWLTTLADRPGIDVALLQAALAQARDLGFALNTLAAQLPHEDDER